MAMKLHKPGQGYWTRMVSAIAAGVLVLAGVEWVWSELSVIQSPNIIYVQAGVALLIVAVFGALLYHLIGRKQRTVDFLIATEGEMKKVNWPERKEVVGSTWVVICCVLLMAAILFAADFLFASLFRYIGILQA